MIEEARIKRNLKQFAFPRLSGTEYEVKAYKKLTKEVENLNLKYEVQRFTFSSFYSRIYSKVAFSSVSIILFLFYLNIYMFILMILILVSFTMLIISIILTRQPEKIQFITKMDSQNVLIKIKSLSKEKKVKDRIVLFISHLDSKGQRFTIRIRIRIAKLWIASSIILIATIFSKNLILVGFELVFYIIGLFPLILNILSTTMMLLNNTDNSSDGAVDNASGIACNLELVNYYSIPENRLKNYDIWFLFTGAEECGTMGIRHFYNNLVNFDPYKSVIFNYESIAKHVYLFPGGKEGDHALNIDSLILNNNRNLTIPHFITKRVFGTHSDGGFLGDRGFQGYGIGEVESYAYMHTPNDTIDKIDTQLLEKLCLVLTDALEEHDSNFFK